jgi:hypothetical protein
MQSREDIRKAAGVVCNYRSVSCFVSHNCTNIPRSRKYVSYSLFISFYQNAILSNYYAPVIIVIIIIIVVVVLVTIAGGDATVATSGTASVVLNTKGCHYGLESL